MMPVENTTICAPATPVGAGAVSLIRISGPAALSVCDRVVRFKKGRATDAAGYSLHFGSVFEPPFPASENFRENAGASLVDEVLVSVFRAPRSYTGEDMVEISCHASPYVVERILSLLCREGAVPAEPGEFTRRAFLSGKMDLSQAEAVADLIASSSRSAHELAIRQMKGGYSRELTLIRERLLHLASLMELELDFSEEEVEFADRSELGNLLDEAIEHCSSLAESFRVGNALKNGIPTAIAGAPNSGKSTLLNALCGQDRAIVSDIEGTTRDTIEETCQADGILFRFIDTAGLRKSSDTIERLGIERSYQAIEQSSAVLVLLDLSRSDLELIGSARDILSHSCQEDSPGQRSTAPFLVFLLNKADLEKNPARIESLRTQLNELSGDAPVLVISLKTSDSPSNSSDPSRFTSRETSVDALKTLLAGHFRSLYGGHETLVSNLRHANALREAADALLRTREGLSHHLPTDLCCQDIREALHHLGTITGQITTDEVLGEIFGKFCIGK